MGYDGNVFVDNVIKLSGVKTQKQLSELIDVDENQISKWRTGKRYPTIETLINIANIINCSIDDLVGINNNRFNNCDDIRHIIKSLFLFDYREYLKSKRGKTPAFDTDYYIYFDKLSFKNNSIIFSNKYDNKPFKELFYKYSALKQTFDILDDDQIILLIDKIISDNKENYPIGDYIEDIT